MTATQTDTELQVEELSKKAFDVFCEDISSVFNIEIKCQKQDVFIETVKGLKKRFGKLAAINNIDSKGFLDVTFQVILDQAGLFTLGGVIMMQPEEEILGNMKKGSVKLAENMADAIGEVGNLLTKSWNKIFEAEVEGDNEFTLSLPAFLGQSWEKSVGIADLDEDHELLLILYQMKVNSFETFQCGVLFPKAISGKDTDSGPEQTIDNPEPAAEKDTIKNDETKEELAEKPESTDKKESSEQTVKSSKDIDTKAGIKEADEKKPKASKKSKKNRKTNASKAIQKMTESPTDQPDRSSHSKATKTAAISKISDFLKIPAKDIMQDQIIWSDPEESVAQALKIIEHENISHILVGKNGVLEGIVSKLDISGAISPYLRPIFAKWHRPSDDATLQIKVKWIMSKPAYTIKTDTPLETILENMNQFKGHALPVTDEQGRVLGIVTDHDIFRTLLNLNK